MENTVFIWPVKNVFSQPTRLVTQKLNFDRWFTGCLGWWITARITPNNSVLFGKLPCCWMQSRTFCVALKRLGTQVGDAVALEVLSPGERLPTPLLCTDKATVVVVLPEKTGPSIRSMTDLFVQNRENKK